MEKSKLEFKESNGVFILEKDNQKITVWQTNDQDVWFGTKEDDVCLELDSRARNFKERSLHGSFKSLMVSIIGRYMLENANDDMAMLPDDFIDLENKTITWHSDNGNDNTLKIVYDDYVIRVYISRGEKSRSVDNLVRVRADESEYGLYYQEFLGLILDLGRVELLSDVMEKNNIVLEYDKEESQEVDSTLSTDEQIPRKLSLKRFFRRQKNDSK